MNRVRRLAQEHRDDLEQELKRLVPALVEMGAHTVILFGSMASAEAGLFSDIDLLVVMDSSLPFHERLAHVYSLLSPMDCDLLVYTPDEFARAKVENPLVRQAMRQGRVLHDTER